MITRRQFTGQLALTALSAAIAPQAFAQAGVARMLVGFPAGGMLDAYARRVADRLRGSLAANVIVENKTGAGGQIAVSTLKDSPADGSNLLISPSGIFTIFPHTYKKLPYSLNDVKPLAVGVFLDPCLAVGPAVPASVKTLKDFIAWTKEDPARGTYGSPGAGSALHLVGAYMAKQLNLDWRHAPYRGAVPGIQDLLGGQISSMLLPVGEFLPYVKTGKVRVLAVSGKDRSRFLPDVPTLRESGVQLTVREWYGFYLSSAAPADVVARTTTHLQTVLTHPDLVSSSAALGMDVQYKNAAETAEILKADTEEWGRLVKSVGFSADS